jgi:hypothetical protein
MIIPNPRLWNILMDHGGMRRLQGVFDVDYRKQLANAMSTNVDAVGENEILRDFTGLNEITLLVTQLELQTYGADRNPRSQITVKELMAAN